MSAQKNRRTAMIAGSVAVAMVGLAYASVPLYDLFCRVTGFGGTTQRAEESALPTPAQLAALHGKSISVRFDANISPGMSWTFKPVRTQETIKIGERKLAFYRATNHAAVPTAGTAAFNVSPDTVGKYFVKIDCFCFSEQVLAAGQTVDMPVTYFIDPAILNDPEAAKVEEITLSYTFFPMDVPASKGKQAIETARASQNAGAAPKEG